MHASPITPRRTRPSRGDLPPARVLFFRGLRGRCPNCGERDVFDGWFHLKLTCPSCAIEFQDEEGFFLGPFMMNVTLVFALIFVLLMALILMLATDANASLWGFMAVGGVAAIAVPFLAYPPSCTTWVALVLIGNWEQPVTSPRR